ncbi:MAG: ATP phosphoribosyltransferase [Planctomycetes bacterium]|jgi:ATP phosphoribosyltransferase|nr:ATP phosphoribosyltransferase [Planctomycetota bacterium]
MEASETKDILKLGIPKGSLQESTLNLFSRAGYNISGSSRSYAMSIDDDQMSVIMFRAQEMSRYVEDGVLDIGLTGVDWILENDSDVVEIAELVYSKQKLTPVRWVLAVPEEGKVKKLEDLEGGIVATELVKCTDRFFKKHGINVKVEFSYGATEAKARLVDGIVDVTETGRSLRENGLRIVDTIMTSSTRLIANKKAMQIEWKRRKAENIALLLKGAIAARERVGLKMNVARVDLDAVMNVLPSQKSPTVSPLADGSWVAVEVIVDEKVERELVPQLKRAGASGIITYPLNKVIP